MITLYQVDEEVMIRAYDCLNELQDHARAELRYPHLGLIHGDPVTRAIFQDFSAVAIADTEDLEDAFRIFQHGMAKDGELIADKGNRTSACVGNVFKKDDRFYKVAPYGFEDITEEVA